MHMYLSGEAGIVATPMTTAITYPATSAEHVQRP